MPAHCLTHNGSSQHPYFRYFSFCQASHPFNIASDYLPVIHSDSPSANFSLCTFYGSHFAVLCAVLDIRKDALKTQEGSHFSLLWHSSQEEQFQIDTSSAPVGFCNTLVFQISSKSNPLRHLSLDTKYCELKPDDRL